MKTSINLKQLILSKLRRLVTLSIVSLLGLSLYSVGLRVGLSTDFLSMGIISICLLIYVVGTYFEQRVFSVRGLTTTYLSIPVPLQVILVAAGVAVVYAVTAAFLGPVFQAVFDRWIAVLHFKSAVLLVGLAILAMTALVGVAQTWTLLQRVGLRPRRLVLMTVIFALSALVFVSTSAAFGHQVTAAVLALIGETREPAPTLTATQYPLPDCHYVLGEWPCIDEVLNTIPRDNLDILAKRNYPLEGFVSPVYLNAICEANRSFLDEQFYMTIPPDERSLWGNDPCNYLVPGNRLVIPVPPTQ